MWYGKGYGRYATDHDEVYRTIPSNLNKVLKEGGIGDVELYNYNHEYIGSYNNKQQSEISSILISQRNLKMSQNEYKEILLTCKNLQLQLEKNKENFTENMYNTLNLEINYILSKTQSILKEGVNEK